MNEKKLTDKKMGRLLFLLCWCVYFSSYIGRLNYSSVMSSMMEEGILTLSQAGSISMVYFFAYGIGQLCNGILGDKSRPQNMIFLGLFSSGMANLLMGCMKTFWVLAALWGINGYMQSMIWPPIIRIFAEKYSAEKKRQYSVDIASSMAVGTLTSYFLSACAMKLFTWQAAFFLAAGIMASIAVIWIIGYRRVDRFLMQKGTGTTVSIEKSVKEEADIGQEKVHTPLLPLVLGSGLMGILLPVMIHGVLKDGITQWVPTYIYDCYDVTSSFSVLVTMVLPLINLTGAYAARYAGRKHPEEEIRTSIWFFGIATAALLCLLLFGKWHVLLAVVQFAIITASMMAVNTLYVNMIPLHFEAQGRVAAVSGLLNATAYLGSAISTFTIGILVEKAGWPVTMVGWVGITAVALAVCVIMRKKTFLMKA